MNTLFDLDAIPTKPIPSPTATKRQSDQRWYIWKLKDGQRYFLWRSHDNGGETWLREADCGRKRPMFYKNGYTARKAMIDRDADGYGVWGGAP